ncbi:hypothetical protein GF327_08235 [Candidatus Woesearchaeota archaeon]|nr:hypothetical protein [Candidatus Woesearchaeota archaeon]
MKSFSEKLKQALFSLLPKTKTFSRITLKKTVADDITEIAKGSYPKEFIALLKGDVKDDTLAIDGLIYQHFAASPHSASMTFDLPMISGAVGSVHSHPGPRNTPSSADLRFFNKRGFIHLIINYPYKYNNIACYDFEGNRLDFSIENF